MQDRNKLPIYQLILMPRSTSTYWPVACLQKNVFLHFYKFDVFVKYWLENCGHSTCTGKMLTHKLLFFNGNVEFDLKLN